MTSEPKPASTSALQASEQYFLLADISGYTAFLANVEQTHGLDFSHGIPYGYEILGALLDVVVQGMEAHAGPTPMEGHCLEVANRMAVRYLGERGPEYLVPTYDRPRYLIKFTPTKITSWEGVEWHEKYIGER